MDPLNPADTEARRRHYQRREQTRDRVAAAIVLLAAIGFGLIVIAALGAS